MKFHRFTYEEILKQFTSSINGLGEREAQERLAQYGPNEIGASVRSLRSRSFFLNSMVSSSIYSLLPCRRVFQL